MKKKETLLRKALKFSIKAHEGVFRKFDGSEYVLHPIRVAKTVRNFKKSKNIEGLLIASLCHDIVEDTNITLDTIRKEFGDMVADLVNELTSDSREIRKIGKTEYLTKKMLNMTSYALVIKLADRLDNCSDFSIAPQKFKEKYTKETKEILSKLTERELTNTHKNLILEIEKKLK